MKTKKILSVTTDIILFVIAWILIFSIILFIGIIAKQEQTKVNETNINSFTNYRALNVENMALKYQLEKAKELDESNYIGEFEITFYCSCEVCCGKSDGIMASGKKVYDGACATDWSLLTKGTRIFIEGEGVKTVEDTGSAIIGNKVDIYIESHEIALEKGIKKSKVYLLD